MTHVAAPLARQATPHRNAFVAPPCTPLATCFPLARRYAAVECAPPFRGGSVASALRQTLRGNLDFSRSHLPASAEHLITDLLHRQPEARPTAPTFASRIEQVFALGELEWSPRARAEEPDFLEFRPRLSQGSDHARNTHDSLFEEEFVPRPPAHRPRRLRAAFRRPAASQQTETEWASWSTSSNPDLVP